CRERRRIPLPRRKKSSRETPARWLIAKILAGSLKIDHAHRRNSGGEAGADPLRNAADRRGPPARAHGHRRRPAPHAIRRRRGAVARRDRRGAQPSGARLAGFTERTAGLRSDRAEGVSLGRKARRRYFRRQRLRAALVFAAVLADGADRLSLRRRRKFSTASARRSRWRCLPQPLSCRRSLA